MGKPETVSEPRARLQRFGPDPRITISASGAKRAARTGLTRVRTRSLSEAQKFLANRAASTREGWIPVSLPPPASVRTVLQLRSTCGWEPAVPGASLRQALNRALTYGPHRAPRGGFFSEALNFGDLARIAKTEVFQGFRSGDPKGHFESLSVRLEPKKTPLYNSQRTTH